MSEFWSLWIIGLTGTCLALISWILFANRKVEHHNTDEQDVPTTGHSADGIEEFDNPLPAWWMYMFVLSIVFGLGYLALYPGLGNYAGLLNWTQVKEWQSSVDQADADFKERFKSLAATPIEELAKDKKAMKMGQRLFSNNCAACHGSNARGGNGYPNLTDNDWLWGGKAEEIKHSVAEGRLGSMPAWENVIQPDQLAQVSDYVHALANGGEQSAEGKTVFQTYCAGCHGMEGKGMTMLGAPNLTDSVWLYGDSKESITESINKGRSGKMPAHKDLIGTEKIHIISAYVFSLSQKDQ